MKVVILQSNYIPWKGYFDLMNMADYFVIYDEVQYSKGDWRNRNMVKTSQGGKWLTIPVRCKGKLGQRIDETEITDFRWRQKHWKTIQANYARASCFAENQEWLAALYADCNYHSLSDINFHFLKAIKEKLNIGTELIWSSTLNACGDRNEKLVDICHKLKATEYISGPAARNYIDERLFAEEGIKVRWMDYGGYPEYRQLHPPFVHALSVIDLLLNEGSNSKKFIKSLS